VVEEVFQTRPEEVDDEDVVQALLAEIVYIRDAGYIEGLWLAGGCTTRRELWLSDGGEEEREDVRTAAH
jgi:hypothetical protein